ncbi:MAG: hypothetical protein ACOCW2_04775 [Chitinivibrionales bacterium]
MARRCTTDTTITPQKLAVGALPISRMREKVAGGMGCIGVCIHPLPASSLVRGRWTAGVLTGWNRVAIELLHMQG